MVCERPRPASCAPCGRRTDALRAAAPPGRIPAPQPRGLLYLWLAAMTADEGARRCCACACGRADPGVKLGQPDGAHAGSGAGCGKPRSREKGRWRGLAGMLRAAGERASVNAGGSRPSVPRSAGRSSMPGTRAAWTRSSVRHTCCRRCRSVARAIDADSFVHVPLRAAELPGRDRAGDSRARRRNRWTGPRGMFVASAPMLRGSAGLPVGGAGGQQALPRGTWRCRSWRSSRKPLAVSRTIRGRR